MWVFLGWLTSLVNHAVHSGKSEIFRAYRGTEVGRQNGPLQMIDINEKRKPRFSRFDECRMDLFRSSLIFVKVYLSNPRCSAGECYIKKEKPSKGIRLERTNPQSRLDFAGGGVGLPPRLSNGGWINKL
jgi:hypothetical protein